MTPRGRPGSARLGGPARPRLVLLLTAGMGAGHTGVATELGRRFQGRGYDVEVVDLLEILPWPLGSGLGAFYAAMLRWTPWLYEAIYRAWFAPRRGRAGPVSPVTWFGGRAVKQKMLDREPVAVVSTFHLCSRILGNLRRTGLLGVPTATMIVDFAVHDLWVDPDVSLHLCLHPSMVDEARQRGAERVTAPGPVVRSCFADSVSGRRLARAALGLADDERAVLIVTGSWGTGDLDSVVDLIGEAPGLAALVVCGADARLKRRLASRVSGNHRVRILGWVGDMDRLMLAADVVVENAGGLTCMEALASGRPVVSFHPIPGHGAANVEAMVRCGIVERVVRAGDLVAAIEAVAGPTPERARRLRAAGEMFRRDAADDILTTFSGGVGSFESGDDR